MHRPSAIAEPLVKINSAEIIAVFALLYRLLCNSRHLILKSLRVTTAKTGRLNAFLTPSAVVVHAAAARPAVPSVNSRPSLVSCRSLHFLEHSARRRAVCTVCLFLPTTAKDIPVSPVIFGHHSLNFRTTLSWTSQQFRMF